MKRFHLFPKGQELSSLIWLLFMIMPILAIFPFDTIEKQVTGGLILVFILCYRNMLFWGKYFLLWLSICYLISSFYMIHLGYIYLFMYPAWQLGFSKIPKRKFKLLYIFQSALIILGLLIGIFFTKNFDENQWGMTIAFTLFTIIAPLSGREFYHRQKEYKQLYQANQRMEAVIKGEERNRIARELHDSLGQSLSVMTIKLDLAQKVFVKKPEITVRELKEVEEMSRSTLKTVREIVSHMRKRGISEELIDSNKALSAAKIILTTKNESLTALLTSDQQTEFSSIIREAITNIIRHSQASYCSISFQKSDSLLEILIEDNGIGPKKVIHGNGLSGMKERIDALRGTMTIFEKNGTAIKFTVPINEEGRND